MLHGSIINSNFDLKGKKTTKTLCMFSDFSLNLTCILEYPCKELFPKFDVEIDWLGCTL